jgi:hypothetical protein
MATAWAVMLLEFILKSLFDGHLEFSVFDVLCVCNCVRVCGGGGSVLARDF